MTYQYQSSGMSGGMMGGGMSSAQMSMGSSHSMSSSSSSGGGGMGGGMGGSTMMSGGSVGGGSIGVGGGQSFALARKTNISRSSGAAAGGSSMMMALSALGGGTATYAGSHGELGANPKAVIQRRVREKHDISDLNVKLAEYIEKNGWYRIKVKEQEKLIMKIKGDFESIEARLRQIYDIEMNNLRATIDATAKEKATVMLKVETLETFYKDFKSKYNDELSAHESTKLRMPKLEKEISEKDAQIDFLAKTLSSLEPQVSVLKSQISSYQREAIDARMAADAEIVARVELESKLVTKQDEIDFLKRVYEEKLRMALDFDIDSDATYSNDLAEALKDIRAEYQAQLESIRGDSDDSWFQTQMNTMMQTAQKQSAELAMAKEEIAKMKTRYSESQSALGSFKAQISSLEMTMAEMSADLENEKKLYNVAIADRDAQIMEFKRQIAAHILELKGLMDAKLSLDEEIGTYRRLLLAGGSTTTISNPPCVVIPPGGPGLHAGATMSSSSTTTTSSGFGGKVSDVERGYYMGVFNDFDRNRDGRINGAELLTMFNEFDNRPFAGRAKRNATVIYCESLMSTADADGSGTLDFIEFLRLMIFEKKIFLKNAFKAADVGGKGYLTEQEVLSALAAAGYEVSDSARALVGGARGGDDGRISYNELVMNL